MKTLKRILVLVIAVNFLGFIVPSLILGQTQTTPFSGNDSASYQCIDPDTGSTTTIKPTLDSETGYYMCGGAYRAVFIPPTLQQVEIWFRQIIYYIWLLVGTYSFLMLVYLGYQWMITRGDVTKITEIRKKILNYIIGFALVFLAIPILSTVFRVLGIDSSVKCYDVNMPGFQFFFANLCTDPKNVITSDPCGVGKNGEAEGYACNIKTSFECAREPSSRGGIIVNTYSCVNNRWVFTSEEI